jgi:PII-like signaling protein
MTPAKRLRIYIGEAEHHHGRPLYRAVVEAARSAGLAGATVLRGIEGYGPKHGLQTAHVVDLSPDLPVVVEIVDEAGRIAAFLPTAQAMVDSGLITLEDVQAAFDR